MFQYYILKSVAMYCCRPLSIFRMNALAPIPWVKLKVAAGLGNLSALKMEAVHLQISKYLSGIYFIT